MANLSKLLSYLRHGQYREIAAAVGERVPSWVYRQGVAFIYEQEKSDAGDHGDEIELPEGYTSRPATRDEMPAAAAITGLPVEEYYRRFDAGNTCFTIFEAGRPVNINWIHRGPCYVRGMGYLHDGDDSDAYIYGIMTDVSQRGKGLYKKCLRLIERYLYAEGARRLIQMVEDGNAAVLHTLPKLGYRHTRTISYRTLLGRRRTRTEEVASGVVTTTRISKAPDGVFRI